jgi:hypothetical protein
MGLFIRDVLDDITAYWITFPAAIAARNQMIVDLRNSIFSFFTDPGIFPLT